MSRLLSIIRDEDIFPAEKLLKNAPTAPYKRIAVRFILLDENNDIALVRGSGAKYYLIPGGGVEDGESHEEAVNRECLEEVGCKVQILKGIGYTEEHRNMDNRVQETYCYLAKVIGDKGTPQTTQQDEIGMEVIWQNPIAARATLMEHRNGATGYNGNFNVRAHLAFIDEYLRNYAK